jgi:hypothetical protein
VGASTWVASLNGDALVEKTIVGVCDFGSESELNTVLRAPRETISLSGTGESMSRRPYPVICPSVII